MSSSRRAAGFSRTTLLGVLAAAIGALSSCASLKDGARDKFSGLASCPPDRVTVVPKPEYRIQSAPGPAAPPDVAADPGRLAYWQHQRDEERKQAEKLVCGDVFDVTGCGQRSILCCGHPAGPGGEGVNVRDTVCVEEPLPPEVK